MAYACDGPGFTVRVDGRTASPSHWWVQAVIAYRPDLDEDERSLATAEARSAAVLGILRESRRGHRLGAGTVHVRIQGDPALAGGFTMMRPGVPPARVA